MRLSSRVSLQWKIFLLVGLGMAILAGIYGLLGTNAVRESTNDALANRLVLAQVAASRLDLVLEYSLGQMERATIPPALNPSNRSSASPDVVAAFLDHVQHGMPLTISYIALIDRQGLVVGAKPSGTLAGGSPAPAQDKVQAALTSGKPLVTSLVFQGGNSGIVYLLAPLTDGQAQVSWLLQAAIDPANSNLSEFVTPLGLGKTGYAEVVDGNGIVLASQSPSDVLLKEDHGDRFATLIAEGRTTTGTCHSCHQASSGGNSPQRTVLAFAPTAQAPWGVVIGQSKSEALAASNRLKGRLYLFGGLTIALAVPLTWIGSRRLMQPLRMLTQSSRRIGGGDLDSPIPQVGEDEVSTLSRALENMRRSLKASQEEVLQGRKELEAVAQRQARELSALVKATGSIAFTLDHRVLLSTVLSVAVDTFAGADRGALFLYNGQSLVARSSVGYLQEELSKVELKPGEAVAGKAFATGEPLICNTPDEVAQALDGLSDLNREHLTMARGGAEVKSMVGAPLKSQGRVLGSLVLSSLTREHAFSQSEVQIISAFAAQAATIIDNAKLALEASQVRALQEADRMKTEFLSNVSHELRTPLTSIKISAESLLAGLDSKEEGRPETRLLRNIQRNTDRLNRLVGELVDMVRLQSGAYKLSLGPVALDDLVQESIESVEPLTQAKGQKITTEISAELPHSFEADRERLVQVLVNLLVNASEHSPEHGKISVTASHSSGNVVVAVADNGRGIPQEEQDIIFQRFYSKPAPGRRKTGLGLGLPIAKALVELHGGKMWVKSRSGEGSVFYFSLPIVREVENAGVDY